ncbi:acyl-CoA dehydrogenase family protein [Mameliella sediminis]|uniref:acyl-CoA dehydrogenase family protein n=1 Tax=Mameliella sediminis TaxID=2836866 RepID=UPI001C444DC6|nr:acyl-CoA dehydrogenase family protein [Mameliella sediminis]MBV7393998.1 acyl-CoA dehydrogenase family protein [Mameliella sediminis]
MTPELLAQILARTPGWAEQAADSGLDDTAITQILGEAAKLAEDTLSPLAARADETGCRVENGRVRTPDGYAAAYRALGEGGWLAADLPEDLGGMGLPLALHVAAALPMEGAALPFMMLPGSSRAAAFCLAANAPKLAAEWCPMLATGQWAATICISEPDAGSDVGRIRTKAEAVHGTWRISGTKCWISFGDHDMTDRIGHLLLARTGAPQEGTRGLSLFLVPDITEDGAPNGIHVERIEEKLGLHGSPTCVLRFENAQGVMIGTPGRGLPALFHMIERMRLQVGTQGAGVAATCAELAHRYAEDRRQGGAPDAPPLPLTAHPDVQRMLLTMRARALLLAALVLETACTLDMARAGDAQAEALAPCLLPLAKTFGGELGQANASDAIQLLGGAGYTREWPAERHFRDVRITTIYEGTTGMQAQDLVLRRLLKDETALAAFTARADACPEVADRFTAVVDRVKAAPPTARLMAADAVMRAAWVAQGCILAHRLAGMDAHSDRALDLWLALAPARMAEAEAAIDWALTQQD